MAPSTIWERLRDAAPTVCAAVDALTAEWVKSALHRLEAGQDIPKYPKILNDAIWGTIELHPCEALLLDSSLLQRLRGIRQLGMAHLVYPGAGYDRLEHSLGVLEAAQQMLTALERNASNQRKYKRSPNHAVPDPSERDRAATRLAALLHDVGHAPFSHATEHAIPTQHPAEFEAANEVLRSVFTGATTIHPAEEIAALVALSDSFRKVLQHPRFDVCARKDDLGEAIASRILGSREFLDATYLSGVVSGPLDADMIDYMARDSHHAGLPLGLDITRLVSKLEVVQVTADNALNPELRARAVASGGRFYELGLSRAGLGAFEQLVMARVTLYERLYYHHKIRAAEGMVRNLVEALATRGHGATLAELFSGFGDDTIIQIWGGIVTCPSIQPGDSIAAAIATRLKNRELLHRSYSFASRFISGVEGLAKSEMEQTQLLLWSTVTAALEDFGGTRQVAEKIFKKAEEICKALPRFTTLEGTFTVADLVVDLAKHSRVSKSTDILVASEGGHIGTPDLFFNAEKWAEAYMTRKQCGYVFAPRHVLQLISLASRIVFYEEFGVAMGAGADVAAKTHGLIDEAVCNELVSAAVCSAECIAVLREQRPKLMALRPEHLQIPEALTREDPQLARRLCEKFNEALPGGLPATVHKAVTSGIDAMLVALQTIESGGEFVKSSRPDEKKDLQAKLRMCLQSSGTTVAEGTEIAGGETDLILSHSVVLENKVIGETDDPFQQLGPAGWQARRYAIALSQRVRFICAAYKPASENGVLPIPSRIVIRRAASRVDDAVEVIFVVPYGHGIPSRAGAHA